MDLLKVAVIQDWHPYDVMSFQTMLEFGAVLGDCGENAA